MVEASGEDSVRTGINLGPVKLVKDINGHPNIVGDGINVAQRIMSFARPGQIVVSRSYYDVVSNLASEYAKLFTYEGSRTDKHVREHEIYVVGHHEGALQKAKDGMKDRASSTTPNARKSKTGTNAGSAGSATVTLTIPSFVQDKKKLTMVAAGMAALVLILAILVVTKKPAHTELAAASPPAAEVKPAAPPPNTGEPSKPVEVRAPESKVVLPSPPASQVPPAAPEAKGDASKSDAARAEALKAEGAKAAAAKTTEAAKADAAKADAAKAGAEKPAAPTVIPATLVFNVSPWGEIFVNGRSQGVTPPKKFIKLDPGKYKIEVRNTTFAPHVENLDLKARDEITVRHKFQ
jgi:hypothetical protein